MSLGRLILRVLFVRRIRILLYCNEDPILEMVAERSEAFIQNKHIKNISLPIGPMALSGSTRMQASSVLQLVVGMSLIGQKNISSFVNA